MQASLSSTPSFDISTDELGGEVATVKQKAQYDQKLSAPRQDYP